MTEKKARAAEADAVAVVVGRSRGGVWVRR